jgi:prevent-host-death family protein
MTIGELDMPQSIGPGEFKAKCLRLLDEVAASREPLVITKFGHPVARIIPMPPTVKLRGALKGTVLYEGDIVSPLENDWEAAL